MTDTLPPERVGTRRQPVFELLQDLFIMDNEQNLKFAVDMSDLLLVAWALLARRYTEGDDIHLAWGYGKAGSKALSHRNVAVGRSNVV